jgi:3-hydroxyisobutyrate dehydrogenase-like beta-hydroxyacid dehydrogenase
MCLAAKGGLDLKRLGEALAASPVASALVRRKVSSMVEDDFRAAFPLKHMHKDLGLMIGTAHALGAAVPVTAGIHQLYAAARSRGYGEEDFAAVFRLLSEMAGL